MACAHAVISGVVVPVSSLWTNQNLLWPDSYKSRVRDLLDWNCQQKKKTLAKRHSDIYRLA
jgi:hypothetical protein